MNISGFSSMEDDYVVARFSGSNPKIFDRGVRCLISNVTVPAGWRSASITFEQDHPPPLDTRLQDSPRPHDSRHQNPCCGYRDTVAEEGRLCSVKPFAVVPISEVVLVSSRIFSDDTAPAIAPP